MARIEHIRYPKLYPELVDGRIVWAAESSPRAALPQILWSDHSPWTEANVWALEVSRCRHAKTVMHTAIQMLGYAKWLEREGVDWRHFPVRADERCTTRFRGHLIELCSQGRLSQSTIASRMAVVVRFYRWLKIRDLVENSHPMWSERAIGIRLADQFGFNRSIEVGSTDLAIKTTTIAGAASLEDGVLPMSLNGMRAVLSFYEENATPELHLMTRIGVGTGMRLGSIVDLKLETFENATLDDSDTWYRIDIGPSARPPVQTKFGVNGRVPFPADLLHDTLAYARSTRRLKREANSKPSDRCLLFLNRFGRSYGGNDAGALQVEISRLRNLARRNRVAGIDDFHFHRTRATFATMLMRCCMASMPLAEAVQFVREACLHRNEGTTMKYVRFIEKNIEAAAVADAFAQQFMGLSNGGGT
ncbi:MAG: tyrosine-type recombinase/integrase [Luteibacter sp.]